MAKESDNKEKEIVHVVDISPLPQSAPSEKAKKNHRRSTKASVLTSTPYKEQLLVEKLKKPDVKCRRRLIEKKGGEKEKKVTKGKKPKKGLQKKKRKKEEAELEGSPVNEKRKRKETEKDCRMKSFALNDYVGFFYEGEEFPGLITDIDHDEERLTIKSMKRAGRYWKWPKVDDILTYPYEDVKLKINPPTEHNRGMFSIPEGLIP